MSNVKWGEFKLEELFGINTTSSFNSDKLTEGDEFDYVTRTSFNQGVLRTTGYVNKNNINSPGTWSLGLLQHDFFYRRKSWYAGQFVRKITPKFKVSENEAEFFTAILNKLKPIFSNVLVRYMDDAFLKTRVFLPVTDGGLIDYGFINRFMAFLEAATLNELEGYIRYQCDGNLDLTEQESCALKSLHEQKVCWKNYKIGDLFYKLTVNKLPYKAKDLTSDVSEDNSVPCLTSSFRNQGLQYYCPESGATILQNVISIPSNSDVYRAYFQTKKFTVLSDAYAVDWIANDTALTHCQYLFMVSCINKVTDLPIYSYKNKLGGWNVVKEKFIVLPTTEKGIDLQLLDDLISAIKKIFLKEVYLNVHRKTERYIE